MDGDGVVVIFIVLCIIVLGVVTIYIKGKSGVENYVLEQCTHVKSVIIDNKLISCEIIKEIK